MNWRTWVGQCDMYVATKTDTEENPIFLEIMLLQNFKMKSPEEDCQVKQVFLDSFTETVTYLVSNFDTVSSSYLCALKPFSWRNRSWTYDNVCAYYGV